MYATGAIPPSCRWGSIPGSIGRRGNGRHNGTDCAGPAVAGPAARRPSGQWRHAGRCIPKSHCAQRRAELPVRWRLGRTHHQRIPLISLGPSTGTRISARSISASLAETLWQGLCRCRSSPDMTRERVSYATLHVATECSQRGDARRSRNRHHRHGPRTPRVERTMIHYRCVASALSGDRMPMPAGSSVAMDRANQYAVLMGCGFDPSRIYIRPLQIIAL
jgi:hypothetical protein